MKKLILSALVVGSLLATSCKDAKEAGSSLTDSVANTADKAGNLAKDGANAVVDGAKDGANAVADGAKGLADTATEAVKSAVGLEGVTIPDFKDPKVKEYLVEYSAYAKEYIAGGTEAYKNTDLMAKGTALATKSADVLKGMDAASAQKFGAVMSAIASKMAPAQ